MSLELRGLDPSSELELFREAFNWRSKRPDHLSFEQWLDVGPHQAMMGLFNGTFLALYMVKEFDSGRYDMHFTSKRGAPREYLIAGGIQITNWLVSNGALEVSAIIMKRNGPLRRFLEDCGYSLDREMTFTDSPYRWLRYVAR